MKIELFKSDARGQIRHWTVEASYDDECLLIYHGALNGQMQEVVEIVETNQSGRDIEEQMDLYANSRAQKKRYQGYKDTVELAVKFKGTNEDGRPRPMLAHKLKDHKVVWACAMLQRKYDGHRCIVTNEDGVNIAYSRNGKSITSIDHILSKMNIPEGTFLDGELYAHGTMLQTINSLVKKPQKASEDLCYIVYDMIDERPYDERFEVIQDMEITGKLGCNATLAETFYPMTKDGAMQLFDRFRAEGYEGAMVRHGASEYECGKRSHGLLKIKSVEDDHFKVVAITPSVDGWAILRCLCKNGKTFTVSAPGNFDKKTEVLINSDRYLEKYVHVEFAFYTNEGIPFHPIATTWKDDE